MSTDSELEVFELMLKGLKADLPSEDVEQVTHIEKKLDELLSYYSVTNATIALGLVQARWARALENDL